MGRFPAAWPHEPGFIPGASWPVPQPTAAGHKARRYNRLRSPEKLATPLIPGHGGGCRHGRPSPARRSQKRLWACRVRCR